MSLDLFEMVADGKLTPEDAADLMLYERELRRSFWSKVWRNLVLVLLGMLIIVTMTTITARGYMEDCSGHLHVDGDVTSGGRIKGVREQTITKVPPNWWIDAGAGKDTAAGINSSKPLKSWLEFQNRLGDWSEIYTTDGSSLITVTLLSDLPATDPLTFRNILGVNTSLAVVGQKKVLQTLTCSAVQLKNRELTAGGTPFAITAPGFSWTPYVNKEVVFTTGAGAATNVRAYVACDLGNGKAQLSNYVSDYPGGALANLGNVSPAQAYPGIGDTFQILDFTAVTVTDMACGQNFESSFNVLYFQNLHIGGAELYFPTQVSDTGLQVVDCIIDAPIAETTFNSLSHNLNNCCSTGGMLVNGLLGIEMGLYTGGTLSVGSAGEVVCDGDTMFIGTTGSLYTGIYLSQGGTLTCGPMSFWNLGDGAITTVGGKVFSAPPLGDSPIYGETGFNAFWGNGTICADANSSISLYQAPSAIAGMSASYHVPTIVGPLDYLGSGSFFDNRGNTKACVINFDTQAPNIAAPGVMRETTWTKLTASADSGGFQVYSGSFLGIPSSISNMTRNHANSRLYWWAQHV